MTDLRQAAQQALEALESLQGGCTDHDDGTVEAITVWCPEVIDALRTALEQQYGQACFEEGREARAIVEPMTEVADRFAHRMALELECVLADRNANWNRAMNLIAEYRAAMNAIHEQHSPTFMGEPKI